MPSSSPCPVARATALLGDRWILLIVRDAFDGVHRFSDFQRSLGVARNILSERLRRLVDGGVLALQPAADGTSYQQYVLTDAGTALFPLVVALRQWGQAQRFTPGEPHSRLVERNSGRELPYMHPRTTKGRVLEAADTLVLKLDQG
ncbi:transcriptional regulator [Stenotrophomonas sp. Betaine-02u-21]|uniref:winged helix-turn-helix transcriptional regulator n=1 Tax=unclassified Stenotrophomonas TaxID=196198 RepID=UPI000C32988A|nr:MULTISPECIES: helix-turn-helix domain-containing protein [unclassified Stenotrophomonas]PKH70210.1 transcriptional regulator [Stenotrophomonas sp. Betaine-02u-23]PKH73761.1 transcriptional regulator [Stenotrophomonas sp. Betaine-02u-21]PKH97633.1 transcriptional regulator [Stenotrophomonas sp. Bg11-02]